MHKYICQSWQGLIQMVVFLVSRGYHHYCLTVFPVVKKDKWMAIDAKLIARYQTDLSKWQRARRKKDGKANYYYLRWNEIAIILHTAGSSDIDTAGDMFCDIRQKAMVISVSALVSFSIRPHIVNGKNHIEVKLTKETYTGIKNNLHEIAKTNNAWKVSAELKKLNGFPCYSQIIRQKRQLVEYAIKQAKRHQLVVDKRQIPILTRLKRYPVFFESI